ncbi:DNA N-6-adenine-methyltransferase [Tengunoibacter tsumagoiensis]|uniref:N-6-adenine-methyltransferase n=1 Tax=Tengunoibacter tsumagoiensis TaxID=2014871 RepID=A0A402A8G9_9CHLR|nr:DNA N-6-adenine-methyltransferase [Tengunoibacter tsumagoiensis]GCE15306.1 N-6-adenine-methyltransferase [Tengunoibacter tsumagoiensis]
MSDEWYTPARYLQAAREVMGAIDLDPASTELANQTVQAGTYYTREQNGLAFPWEGRVWLNPPFGRRQTPGKKTNQGVWITKLVQEYQAGRVSEAILLTTGRTDTSWFSPLWDYPICFTDHKVGFFTPSSGKILQECGHTHGTIFVYLGPQRECFLEVFSQFGVVAQRVSPAKTRPQNLALWNGVFT